MKKEKKEWKEVMTVVKADDMMYYCEFCPTMLTKEDELRAGMCRNCMKDWEEIQC